MNDGFIELLIKQKTRKLFITALVLVVVSVFGIIVEFKVISNYLSGPSETTFEALNEAIATKGIQSISNDFVSIEGIDSFSSGLQQIETRNKVATVLSEYYYLDLGKKYIIVVTQPNKPIGNKVTGTIVEVPADVMNESRAISVEGGLTEDEFNASVMPIMLDAANQNRSGAGLLIWSALLLCVAFIISIFVAIRSIKPESHPSFRSLSKFGDSRSVADAINQEMQSDAHACFESISVSDSWLVCETGYSFKVFNIEDLVWFYQMVSKRKLYFIIPIWQTNKLVLGLRTKKLFRSGNLQEQTINSAIKYISGQIPWAFAGFSVAVNNVWAKSPQQLIDLADQRKNEYLTVQSNSESAESVSSNDDQLNNEESLDQTIN